MSTYEFEIQSCINVDVDGDDAEDARRNLTDSLADYANEMIEDCSISDGEKK